MEHKAFEAVTPVYDKERDDRFFSGMAESRDVSVGYRVKLINMGTDKEELIPIDKDGHPIGIWNKYMAERTQK